jgi:hypothetical protein
VAIGIPLWQLQVATAIGLLGVWIGWRGGMSRMIGFYDLPAATRLLLFGFFFGVLYGFFAVALVMHPMWQGILLPLVPLLMVALGISLATMFLLTREGVRRLNGQPTAGWTFGLGMGSMLVVRLIYEVFAFPDDIGHWIYGFNAASIALALGLVLTVPWTEAIICSWQGWNALEGRRFKPAFKAMLARSILLVILTFGVVYPLVLLFLPPFIMWGQTRADQVWLPSGLSPRMKQEWSRLTRTGIATGVRAVSMVDEEE